MNIYFENITKIYDGKEVLNAVSGKIYDGEKVGLIGSNGIGKSTLAKIIAGLESFDSGVISYLPDKEQMAYLNQDFLQDSCSRIDDAALREILYKGKVSGENDIKAMFLDLNITDSKLERSVLSFSGGEKTKLMLAKVFLEDTNFLILDEPTNHRDIESKEMLQKLINRSKKTMLIISHDRYFLDRTVGKILEMSEKGIKEYNGNYSDYKSQKNIELKNQLKEHEKQQKAIVHLKEVISDRKDWFDKAHKAAGQNDFLRAKAKKQISIMRSKEKQLQRLEANKIDKPKEEKSPCFEIINKYVLNLKLPRYLIQVKALNKSFGKKTIFNMAAFDVLRGDKIAIIGKNGSGKTTLLNILAGLDKDFKAEFRINPSVKIAYFSQQLEGLDYSKNILDNLLRNGADKAEARNLLASILFKDQDVFKNIGVLSMGERCRVAIAKLILSGANMLILDEPTNYMDISSRERIEETLIEFQGSIIFVSHDIYFSRRIANKIVKISGGTIETYPGGYDYYQEKTCRKPAVEDYTRIKESITKLECELAFIGGRLNEKLTENEKETLNSDFIIKAKELISYKSKLNK